MQLRLKVFSFISLMFLLCFVQSRNSCCIAADDYMVLRLDDFAEAESVGEAKLSAGELAAENLTDDNLQVQIYPLGKPLQVEKSYLLSNAANTDSISRSISGVTNRYVPEIFTGMRNSVSTAEKIQRYYLGFYKAINNEWSWGARLHAGLYDLVATEQQEADSSNLFMFDFGTIYKPDTEWRIYNGLVLGGTHDVVSVGARSRVEYSNRGGIGAVFSGELWAPWAENTIAAKENGRTSGLSAEVTLPLTHRLTLTLNSAANWRVATDGMYSTKQFIGTELQAGGRVNWNFFQRSYRQQPVEFLGQEYFSYEAQSSYFGVFASLQAATYVGGDPKKEEDYLIPVTKEQLDQRVGLSGSYVFNAHFAATAEIYLGYDPAREIDFGKLYGFNSRIIYIPTARLRVYGEFALDSEAATGIEEGKTWYYGAGLNYKF